MLEVKTDVKLSDIIVQIENGDVELESVFPASTTAPGGRTFFLYFRLPEFYNRGLDEGWVYIRIWLEQRGHESYLHEKKIAINIIRDVPLSQFYSTLQELYTMKLILGDDMMLNQERIYGPTKFSTKKRLVVNIFSRQFGYYPSLIKGINEEQM